VVSKVAQLEFIGDSTGDVSIIPRDSVSASAQLKSDSLARAWGMAPFCTRFARVGNGVMAYLQTRCPPAMGTFDGDFLVYVDLGGEYRYGRVPREADSLGLAVNDLPPETAPTQASVDSAVWRRMFLEYAIDRIRPVAGGRKVDIVPIHGSQPSRWLVAFLRDIREGVAQRPTIVDSGASPQPVTTIEFGEPAAPTLPSYPPGFKRHWRLPMTTSHCASNGGYYGSFVDLTVVEIDGRLRMREDGYGTFDGVCATRRLDVRSPP
jgi:hypothetical protein